MWVRQRPYAVLGLLLLYLFGITLLREWPIAFQQKSARMEVGQPEIVGQRLPDVGTESTVSDTEPVEASLSPAAVAPALLQSTLSQSTAVGTLPVDALPVNNAESAKLAEPGQLLLLNHSQASAHQLELFDLATEQLHTLFKVPEGGWISHIDVAADGEQVLLAYTAPLTDEQAVPRRPFDRNGIYLFSLADSTTPPTLLFGEDEANRFFFSPTWSPDGQSIYYVSYRRLLKSTTDPAAGVDLDVALYQYDVANETHTFMQQDAVWPRVSPDGTALVYIQVDPETQARSVRTTTTGEYAARELVSYDHFMDVDTPHFSADGEWIYFSATSHSTKVSSTSPTRRWWEILLDVQVAHAHTDHNVPGDWWRVSVAGGEPERITSLYRLISYGEFDGEGQRLFFTTETGVYVTDVDGMTIERLPLPNLYRFIAWSR